MSSTTEASASDSLPRLNVEQAVAKRYSAASKAAQPALCCPVSYDQQYLKALPDDLIERDYGCGNPSAYVREGDAVLDLGSGGGKICYIASQIVGREGCVHGVDMNDDMLALARRYQSEISENIGWDNVVFHKGRIQDLALDLDRFDKQLQNQPIASADGYLAAMQEADRLRNDEPMIASDSIDVVLSNCVLNLVREEDRHRMFREIYRVLARGGRAVISDIVCDEEPPARLRNNPELWSGCLSGAFVEDLFLEEFEAAGLYGVEIVERQEEPWATVEGIEFRSITVRAFKGKEGPCLEQKQAVVYRGPWKSVTDDDGHVLRRGVRSAVCGKTFKIYTGAPYGDDIIPIPPREEVAEEKAEAFDCHSSTVRPPRETKGVAFDKTKLPAEGCCDSDGGCC